MFNTNWDLLLKDEIKKDYFQKLMAYLGDAYLTKTIYPSKDNLFTAFNLTDYNEVKVVVLGQDPYHNHHQAHGLAFSVFPDAALPPSLKNIYKEIESDLGIKMSKCGNLVKWAKQGIFLLNTILTVEENKPGSHKGIGWEKFTDKVIEILNTREKSIIFIFWGNEAKAKAKLITSKNHIVLSSCHPSPLSVYHGFFGCKHFSQVNSYLKAIGEKEIDWQI